MVTAEQVKRGLAAWMDAEVLPKIDSDVRDLLGVGVALKIARLQPEMLAEWLVPIDEHNFDLEATAAVLLPRLRNKPMQLKMEGRKIPLVGEIPGISITVTEQTLHDVVAYINRS